MVPFCIVAVHAHYFQVVHLGCCQGKLFMLISALSQAKRAWNPDSFLNAGNIMAWNTCCSTAETTAGYVLAVSESQQSFLTSLHALQPDTTIRVGDAKVEVDRKLGRQIQTLSRVPGFLAATISFKTQQVMLGSTWNKMIAVFAIGIPACVLGGAAYSLASGRDILTGFIQAYGALYKIPGELILTGCAFCQLGRLRGLALTGKSSAV